MPELASGAPSTPASGAEVRRLRRFSCLIADMFSGDTLPQIMSEIQPTRRTTLKRLPKRGSFNRNQINSILDEGFICHVGFIVEGKPVVIPTGYARAGDRLLIHGSQASRMLRSVGAGVEVCVEVTVIDALVLARSAFHHSMNYRSVVIFGTATMIEAQDEKVAALRALSEHMIPGRWDDVRQPNDAELQQTTVLSIPLTEVSAKIRSGPPLDDEEDYELPIWAGVIPLRLSADAPVADSKLKSNLSPPDYASAYRR
jgi:nitroimidazol reductase NimA-like FMN-containing flavoprotein (pyridoxamine 5'-phosphate oxidase superfamily)